MPEQIQSASVTAEWEQKLLQVEQGELDGGEFMSGMPSTGSDQRSFFISEKVKKVLM